MLKRPSDDTHPPCDGSDRASKKTRKEGQVADDADEEGTSDETWSPSEDEMADDESGEDTETAPPPTIPTKRVLRSSGPVQRPGDEMHPIMDKIDEVIDNESDFSSTTDEEEEEDEESEDDGEEEEEDESDTEEDGYSDDDSFVTSCDEDEAEEDDDEENEPEPTQTTHDASELNPEITEGPVTTDELLANFDNAPEPSLPAE
jgi:hypothetical protein